MTKRLYALLLVFSGLLFILAISALVEENPLRMLELLISSSFYSWQDFRSVVHYAFPLLICGFAVALPYRAGLFNIGAEGQIHVGNFTAFLGAYLFPRVAFPFSLLIILVFGILGGALWGGINGYIRAFRKGHEVIVSIMMNYIALGLTTYLALEIFRNPEVQNPETIPITQNFFLQNLNLSDEWLEFILLAFATLLLFAFDWYFSRSKFGFAIRAIAANSRAARINRFPVEKLQWFVFVIGGASAGLIGLQEMSLTNHKFLVGFSLDYGFMGIAVAFLAGKRFWMLLPVSILLGALFNGATIAQLESKNIISEIALVFQAALILWVVLWNSRSKLSFPR